MQPANSGAKRRRGDSATTDNPLDDDDVTVLAAGAATATAGAASRGPAGSTTAAATVAAGSASSPGKKSGKKRARNSPPREEAQGLKAADGDEGKRGRSGSTNSASSSASAAARSGPTSTPTAAGPVRSASAPDGEAASGGGGSGEQLELFTDVLEGMKRNDSAVIDTRLNFTYGLPRKARIPRTREQWRLMQNVQGKLTNNYAQIDSSTIKLEGPIELVSIQNVRADNNNFRFLKPDELEQKLRSLPRTAMLGSPASIAQHPMFASARVFRAEAFAHPDAANAANAGAAAEAADPDADGNEPLSARKGSAGKKQALLQEWIFWVRDRNRRHAPMTIATFAHLYNNNRIQPIVIDDPSGWMIFSDEDRNFIIPRSFCPTAAAALKPQQSRSALNPPAPVSNNAPGPGPLSDVPITPAVRLSKGAVALLPELLSSAPKPATTAVNNIAPVAPNPSASISVNAQQLLAVNAHPDDSNPPPLEPVPHPHALQT
jgi:hypothetical protein